MGDVVNDSDFLMANFGRIDATAVVFQQFLNQASHPIGIILSHLVEFGLRRLDRLDGNAALVTEAHGTARDFPLEGIADDVETDDGYFLGLALGFTLCRGLDMDHLYILFINLAAILVWRDFTRLAPAVGTEIFRGMNKLARPVDHLQ